MLLQASLALVFMSLKMVPKVVDIVFTMLLSANARLVTCQTFDTYQTITYLLINCLVNAKRYNDHQTYRERAHSEPGKLRLRRLFGKRALSSS